MASSRVSAFGNSAFASGLRLVSDATNTVWRCSDPGGGGGGVGGVGEGVRGFLTCSLNKLGVQVKRDDGDGEVSQVELQSTGDDVDVGEGTGTDVSLIAICWPHRGRNAQLKSIYLRP